MLSLDFIVHIETTNNSATHLSEPQEYYVAATKMSPLKDNKVCDFFFT